MILIRFALIGLTVYLLLRAFMRYGREDTSSSQRPEPGKNNDTNKKVSKKIGEYVDYEEVANKKP